VPALRGRFPQVPAVPDPRVRSAKAQQTRQTHRAALGLADAWFRPDRGRAAALVTVAGTHQAAVNYALWSIVEWHLAAGRLTEADALAARAVTYGYFDPRTVNHHLTHLTEARRAGDIATALQLCSVALAIRHGSTDVGWHLVTSLASTCSASRRVSG
jgi:hypothetical protein